MAKPQGDTGVVAPNERSGGDTVVGWPNPGPGDTGVQGGEKNPLAVPLPDLVERITVKYGETVSVGDYSNVRIDVEYVAQEKMKRNLDGSILKTRFYDPHAVRDDLLARAKLAVQTEVDLALEAHGQPTKYYDGLKYDVRESFAHSCVVLAPVGYELPDNFFSPDARHSGLRLPVAKKLADRAVTASGHTLYDLTDPIDMARTPPWLEKEKLAEEEKISNLIQPDKELPSSRIIE